MEKIEKDIEDIGKELKEIKKKQRKTQEKMEELKIEKLEEEIYRLSQRGSFEMQEKPVEKTKVFKIDIKKASVPITLKTSQKAIVVEF